MISCYIVSNDPIKDIEATFFDTTSGSTLEIVENNSIIFISENVAFFEVSIPIDYNAILSVEVNKVNLQKEIEEPILIFSFGNIEFLYESSMKWLDLSKIDNEKKFKALIKFATTNHEINIFSTKLPPLCRNADINDQIKYIIFNLIPNGLYQDYQYYTTLSRNIFFMTTNPFILSHNLFPLISSFLISFFESGPFFGIREMLSLTFSSKSREILPLPINWADNMSKDLIALNIQFIEMLVGITGPSALIWCYQDVADDLFYKLFDANRFDFSLSEFRFFYKSKINSSLQKVDQDKSVYPFIRYAKYVLQSTKENLWSMLSIRSETSENLRLTKILEACDIKQPC